MGYIARLIFLMVLFAWTGLGAAFAAERPQQPRVYRDRVEPHWFQENHRFWYRNDLPGDEREFVLVDVEKGSRQPAFDHGRVATALSKVLKEEINPAKLPIHSLKFQSETVVELHGLEGSWKLNLESYELTSTPSEEDPASRLTPEFNLRPSARTGPESRIVFQNKSTRALALYWMDPSGNRQPYGLLKAGESRSQHTFAGHVWLTCDSESGAIVACFEAASTSRVALIEENTRPANPSRRGRDRSIEPPTVSRSPDGTWEAFVRDDNLWLRRRKDNWEGPLSADGNPGNSYRKDASRDRLMGMEYDKPDYPPTLPDVFWAPNSKRLIALQTRSVPERRVHLIESSPKDQLQPKLHSYPYLKPGDEIPLSFPRLFEVELQKQIPLEDALFPNPWDLSDFRWDSDGLGFTFLYNQRGHQLMRILACDARSGEMRTIVEEKSATFIDYSGKKYVHHLEDSNEIVWMSERDGWNHLYLYDAKTGAVKNQITRGPWVVRSVERVDPESRTIWLRVAGIYPDQDPYYLHLARVNFDGSGLVFLTEANGSHFFQFSPDRRCFIDTWSRVDAPPKTELRRSDDGKLICALEEADASECLSSGRRLPQPFSAKGRDGTTGIFGVIHWPVPFDPEKKYPVIENIYAGPHGAHVPKTFRASYGHQRFSELGFIITQIDGMGTSQRSKAFHDVCWKNLADAGFPDRILWMKAAAEKFPALDLSRVGIYGGSAGGQNAARAVLGHGDFYKAAAADCGCHDNRMDKIWWNEQWMGWPIGPHYAEQSNVTQAHRLQGKLLLIVGELDRNVDPASTLQFANALIKADKDFDLLLVPGAGHGAAGTPYARKRMTEFFLRELSH